MRDDRNLDTRCWHTGYCFVKSGLWFFIIGVILGFGVLAHYLFGSAYDNSQYFLSNITLWFGSPLTLSSGFLQVGGLAMAIVGLAHSWKNRNTVVSTTSPTSTLDTTHCPTHKSTGLILCNIGLIALAVTGFIGYFVIDWIWPGFYYIPILAGKNWWLILQGLSILLFLIGFLIAACCCCKCCRHACNKDGRDVPPNTRP